MRSARRLFIYVVIIAVFLIPKESRCDIFQFKYGGEPIEGKIIEETETQYTVKLKGEGKLTFPKSLVQSIKKTDISDNELYTKQDLYAERLEKVNPKDAAAQLELAKWCLENGTPDNGLNKAAIRHFKTAEKLDPEMSKKYADLARAIQDKEAEKSYAIAESAYKAEEYIAAENMALSIVYNCPRSSYVAKAKAILTEIWGPGEVEKALVVDTNLPEILLEQGVINSISKNLNPPERRNAYFAKCLNKAMAYERRAQDIERGKRAGYYIAAISCYDVAVASDSPEIKEDAEGKRQGSIKKFFEMNPLPDNDAEYSRMYGYLKKLNDPQLLKKICERYFKSGGELCEEAKKLKQPEKREKASTAYFYFSIVNNFSNDEKVKQESSSKMVECQRIVRELK